MPRRTSGRFSTAISARGHKAKSSLFKKTDELAYVKQRMTTKTLSGMKDVHDMGLSPNLINAIINGDLKSAQKLGAMGEQGRKIQTLLPEIAKDSLDFITGTQELNNYWLETYKAGMAADTAIKQGSRELGTANLQHSLDLAHNKEQWVYDNQALRQSAQHARELLQVNAWLLEFNKNVDHNAALNNAANNTRRKMLNAQLKYNVDALKEMLKYGDDADLSLITQKDYSGFNGITSSTQVGILGFGQALLATVKNGIRALLPNI